MINLAAVTLPNLAAPHLPVVVLVGSQDELPLPPRLRPMFTDHLLYQKPGNATTVGRLGTWPGTVKSQEQKAGVGR